MDEATLNRKTKETKNGLRCRKHPGYAVKGPPQYTKAYPTGCPVCIALWEKYAPEEPEVPEVIEPEIVEEPIDPRFKEGPENPNWKKKVDDDDPIWEIVRKYTQGGEKIVAEVAKIAGIHPTSTLNCKGVNYKDKFQALKWLKDVGWGPNIDPESDKVAGIQIAIINLGEGSFVDYKKNVIKELGAPQDG